ncbi:hypothetical protein HQ531_08820 [bacterium]|nr:hypothetical protein [bacterium]
MNKHQLVIPIVFVIGISSFILSSCDTTDPDEVSPEDSTAAVLKVDAAIAALETVMDELLNSDPDSVQAALDLLDFSGPYALFVEANELDHRNADANFGLGFTGFLMLSQDDQLQEMLLRWESYFNMHEPFVIEDPPAALMRSGYGLPLTIDGIRIPIAPLIEMPMALSKMSIDDVPQFSEFQDLVGSLFLPIIEESITALEYVDDNPDYIFEISAIMQGDDEADPIEIDLTEIYVLEMGLYALKGVMKTVVAYNFDFVSFDAAGIDSMLSQGSDFATLRDNGSVDLALALASTQVAADKALAAIDFLESETDSQSDDLIRLDDGDDLTEIRDMIEDVQSALEEPTMIHYDYWDDVYVDGEWVDEVLIEDSINVDISKFFNNPIDDFKAMLPPYSMGTMIDYDYEQTHINEYIEAEDSNVTVPGLNGAYIAINLSYDTFGPEPNIYAFVNLGFFGYNLATANPDDLPTAVWDMYAEFLTLIDTYSSDLYHYPYIYFTWSGTVTSGESLLIQGNFIIEYEEQVQSYVVPDPQWNAGTYAEWLNAWPDPTMNEIFPGLDAEGLANLLDFDEENWNDFNN